MIATTRALASGFLLAVQIAAAGTHEPVAIVYQVSGEALSVTPGRSPKPLRLFARLPAGTAVELASGSRLALAFVTGRRYELSGPARATLGKGDLAARSGGVRSLLSVPPLPRLAPIAENEHPGPTAGAVRLRGDEIEGLFPGDGAMTLAGATVLKFQPASGAARYQVEIEDARGTVVFHLLTEASAVSIPAEILAPGARYHWQVKTLDKPGPAAHGEADFATLSRENAEARERLRQAVKTLADDGARALLTAVDHELGLASEPREDPVPAGGAVVESVTPGSPGEKAGLRPGDVILAWSSPASPPAFPQGSGGGVHSPYDLLPVEIEEAPRRAVELRGTRGGQEMTWRLSVSDWGIETRPSSPERSASWLLTQRARELAAAGKWPEADAAYAEALAALEREPAPRAAAQLLQNWGKTLARRGAGDAAVERYQQALALERRLAPKSLAEARTLDALGIAAAKRGDFPTAGKFLRQALAIREELAPGTAEVTGSLNNLGILAHRHDDLAAAEEYLTRGEEMQRRLAPESADHALFFQNLGNLASTRGELERAESWHRQALAIFEKTDPSGEGVEDCLSNLASVAIQRGDLAVAGDLLQRLLAHERRNAPQGTESSSTLIILGNLASRRGDLEAAEAHYRRALAIEEKGSPNGPGVAKGLASLGIVAALKEDFATARTYLRRSLAIKEKLAPGSLSVAESLERLGRLETDSGGDLARAEELLRRALAIFESQGLESLSASEILRALGQVTARRGRLPEALALLRRSLELQRKLAPGTTGEAEALYFLGLAERRAGRPREGAGDFCGAVDVLDRQRARVGDTQGARTSFEASLGDYYYACLESLVQLGRPAEAFHTLERGRARSFLALLSQRDLRLADLPPELAAERRHLDAGYDHLQARLALMTSGRDASEIERLTGELRDLRTRQEEMAARIRRESPRSSALQDPQPLDLAGARAALDPGTVLLEYAVGAERSWLFVVRPSGAAGPGLSVFPVAAGKKALREEVEGLRRLLKRPSSDRAALRTRALRLYRLLVRPAEEQIAGARRILVSSDGPLRTLPFATLMRGDRYLVEWRPIHSVLSATVYAELERSRPSHRNLREERLAAFGDPSYPHSAPATPTDPEVREIRRRGWALKPLPSSRKEVEAIAALYPGAHAYLGQEATEERAKSLGPDSRLIHFACHGLLDERFPLNSALVLALPDHQAEGQDNGLLQAWEIFERVRLDADLVTLSACDTALGQEMGGEGLVGLTRAFQYAGARSVLASLWGVADYSTARFMKSFYGYLRAGRPKDEALRAAQIDQIRKKSGSSHPFFWAAFELSGDWH